MRERPILFNSPMVRALLEGRKTQTRRTVKPQPFGGDRINREGDGWVIGQLRDSENAWRDLRCPYGVPGDRLWVRESWAAFELNLKDIPLTGSMKEMRTCTLGYRATEEERFKEYGGKLFAGPWRSGRFMPRWASRLTLEVTEVRVQRLQEISEEDAEAEGLIEHGAGFLGFPKAPWQRHATDAYRNLWESINGPGSWAANPYVWAITLRRLEGGAE